MSRSYRKSYATFCGYGSAHDDKTVASRAWRRKQNQYLMSAIKGHTDWDEYINPERYEAAFNDVWCWARDGKQRLHFPPKWEDELHWFHCNYFTEEKAMEYALEYFEKAKQWYAKISRK